MFDVDFGVIFVSGFVVVLMVFVLESKSIGGVLVRLYSERLHTVFPR